MKTITMDAIAIAAMVESDLSAGSRMPNARRPSFGRPRFPPNQRRVAGAWLDGGKQFSQNYRWSGKYLDWRVTDSNPLPASGTSCNGTYNGTFVGNVTVSAGQVCNFIGGGIKGNLTSTGGTLGLSGATVSGNVQIAGGTFSIGPSTTIQGNLQISKGVDIGVGVITSIIVGLIGQPSVK